MSETMEGVLWPILRFWFAVIFLWCPNLGQADEGLFWLDPTLYNVPHDLIHAGYGGQLAQPLTPRTLQKMAKGVVRLVNWSLLGDPKGWGTGSVISPKGLGVTARHVMGHCLSVLRLEENKQGFAADDPRLFGDDHFFAQNESEERRCVGLSALQTVHVAEVTEKLATIYQSVQFDATKGEIAVRAFLEECKKNHKVAYCQLHSAPTTPTTFLVAYNRYDDVRLVYAPSQEAAELFGYYRNFTGTDFALFRIYGKDAETGKAVALNTENEYLKHGMEKLANNDIVMRRLEEDDFVMTMGYPFGTQRLHNSAYATLIVEKQIPYYIKLFGLVARAYRERFEEIKNKVDAESRLERLTLKPSYTLILTELWRAQTMKTCFGREAYCDALTQRKNLDAELKRLATRTVNGKPENEEMHTLWSGFETDLEVFQKVAIPANWASLLLFGMKMGSSSYMDSHGMFPLGIRDSGMKRRLFVAFLDGALDEPLNQRLWGLEYFVEKHRLERSGETILRFIQQNSKYYTDNLPVSDLKQDTKDPLIELLRLLHLNRNHLERQAKKVQEGLRVFNAIYIGLLDQISVRGALATRLGEESRIPLIFRLGYDDANGSLRMSYGQIKGVSQTVSDVGMNMADYSFDQGFYNIPSDPLVEMSPTDQLRLSAFVVMGKHVFHKLPVSYFSTLDGATGSSGSPVFDKDLNVVGVVFAQNMEALTRVYGYEGIPKGRLMFLGLDFAIQYMNWDVSRGLDEKWSPRTLNRISKELMATK